MKKIFICALIFYTTISHAQLIDGVLQSERGVTQLKFNLKHNYVIAEGDIILATKQDMRPGSVVVKSKTDRWENGIIPFKINNNLPVENQQNVLAAMIEWLNHTSIQFVNITNSQEAAYQDYIVFTAAPGTECSSYVGKHGGKQVIRLAPRCNVFNTVHEIGHALGLWHEQSRSDRDNYIRIAWENIAPEMLHNFEQHLNDGKDIGEYDYESLMHYGPHAFSTNGKQTIIPIKEGAEIGQRTHLSDKDIRTINTLYPKKKE